MILSVSRRTDIPAFYSDWFYNRVREGFALVRNPWYTDVHKVSKILINPEVCDCIVFWTKNPAPMLARLDEIKDYPYYFHFSVNPYNQNIECKIPKKKQIVDTFRRLADKIGSERVIWRYQPVLFTNEIDANYHIKYFEWLAKHLSGYTTICKLGFVAEFKKNIANMKQASVRTLSPEETLSLATTFVDISKAYNIELQTCSNRKYLQSAGVKLGHCTDSALIEQMLGVPLKKKRISHKKNVKENCGCLDVIDIGEYNTCPHNCIYCYANHSPTEVLRNKAKHNTASPILIGTAADCLSGATAGCLSGEGALRPSLAGDKLINIKERKCVSFRLEQGYFKV